MAKNGFVLCQVVEDKASILELLKSGIKIQGEFIQEESNRLDELEEMLGRFGDGGDALVLREIESAANMRRFLQQSLLADQQYLAELQEQSEEV